MFLIDAIKIIVKEIQQIFYFILRGEESGVYKITPVLFLFVLILITVKKKLSISLSNYLTIYLTLYLSNY